MSKDLPKITDYIQEFGYLALGSRLRRLSDLLFEQVLKVYRAEDIELEPRLFPLFALLAHQGTQTINEAKAALGVTHAAASQMATGLKSLKMAELRDDPNDRRRTLVTLTPRGKRLASKAKPVWIAIKGALKDIAQSSKGDLLAEIAHFESALGQAPLYAKGATLKASPTPHLNISIESYAPKYAKDFKMLNEAWLKEFKFKIEAADKAYFHDPEGSVISQGGEIFFAVAADQVLGSAALIHHGKSLYELAKMSVLPKARGRGIGKILAEAAIAKAQECRAKKLFLETNSKLLPAIRLYESLGFKKVPLRSSKYTRADLRMELPLI